MWKPRWWKKEVEPELEPEPVVAPTAQGLMEANYSTTRVASENTGLLQRQITWLLRFNPEVTGFKAGRQWLVDNESLEQYLKKNGGNKLL